MLGGKNMIQFMPNTIAGETFDQGASFQEELHCAIFNTKGETLLEAYSSKNPSRIVNKRQRVKHPDLTSVQIFQPTPVIIQLTIMMSIEPECQS